MTENLQNSCLMVTGMNEDTGKHEIMYIPLNIDWSVVELFLQKGTCTNKQIFTFELTQSPEETWAQMWKELEEGWT